MTYWSYTLERFKDGEPCGAAHRPAAVSVPPVTPLERGGLKR